ncbi:MAG: hypothetical protein LH606_18865 [Cytophagaceae bacterium]|nr:hypothetical protein [Cytophagaceae bacterium]
MFSFLPATVQSAGGHPFPVRRNYNIVTIPLAAGALYPNFVFSPALGAVLMSASTVVVALNAQLLKRSLNRDTISG